MFLYSLWLHIDMPPVPLNPCLIHQRDWIAIRNGWDVCSLFLIILYIPYICHICCMHQILVLSSCFTFITEDANPNKIVSSILQIKKRRVFTSGIWGTGKLRPNFVNSSLLLDINLKSQEPDFSKYIVLGMSESKRDTNDFIFYTVFWGKQVYSDRQKNINRKTTDISVSTWYQETKRNQTLY